MKAILFLAIFALAGYIASCTKDSLPDAGTWIVFFVLFGLGMFGLSRIEEDLDKKENERNGRTKR